MTDLQDKLSSIGIARVADIADSGSLEVDIQGWGSSDPIFERVIQKYKPKIILEIGSWKGASAITMAKHSSAEIICVDTWTGSNDTLWLDPVLRPLLRVRNGFPDLYRQFTKNIKSSGFSDRIYPVPMTSECALKVFRILGIQPDVVYIDGDHSYKGVMGDLIGSYQLNPRSVLFGDDYSSSWPGVVAAVQEFNGTSGWKLNIDGCKWIFE